LDNLLICFFKNSSTVPDKTECRTNVGVGDISKIVPSTCKQATETLPDLQMEVGRGNTCSLRPKENFMKDKFHDTNQVVHGTNEEHPFVQHAHSYRVNSKCVTGGDGIEVGFSTFLQSDASLPGNTNQFSTTCTKLGSGAPDDVENGYGAFVDSKRVDANKTIRILDGVRNSTSDSEMAEHDMEMMGIADDNSFLPIKREAGRVHLTSLFINEQSVTESSVLSKGVLSNGVARKWCRKDHGQKTTSSGKQNVDTNYRFMRNRTINYSISCLQCLHEQWNVSY